jgi:hypothetical protein
MILLTVALVIDWLSVAMAQVRISRTEEEAKSDNSTRLVTVATVQPRSI